MSILRPLLLSASDLRGGAARAALRLHRGLRSIDVDSRLLVQEKLSDDAHVYGPAGKTAKALALLKPALDRLALPAGRRPGAEFSAARLPDRVAARVRDFAPDLVHLHWINGGFIGVPGVARLPRPLVWTLHDMWPFTGGCHYDASCGRYTEACGHCPQLGAQRPGDLSRRVWRRKRRHWSGLPVTLVTPSRWLADCARRSSLLGRQRIEVIPNGLDLEVFKPTAQPIARSLLNLDPDRRYILFGAVNSVASVRKGFSHLRQALAHYARSQDRPSTELLVFGARGPEPALEFDLPTRYLGTLQDELSLAVWYCAADVFVAPSQQDNLPNTVVEAMACATPCVAFDVGGMADLIDHESNGYLAPPFDAEQLSAGIAQVLNDPQRRSAWGARARDKAEAQWDLHRVAQRYRSLYEELVAARPGV